MPALELAFEVDGMMERNRALDDYFTDLNEESPTTIVHVLDAEVSRLSARFAKKKTIILTIKELVKKTTLGWPQPGDEDSDAHELENKPSAFLRRSVSKLILSTQFMKES